MRIGWQQGGRRHDEADLEARRYGETRRRTAAPPTIRLFPGNGAPRAN
jgi:hypothetical protein